LRSARAYTQAKKNTKAKRLRAVTGILYHTAQLFCSLKLMLKTLGRVFPEGKKYAKGKYHHFLSIRAVLHSSKIKIHF